MKSKYSFKGSIIIQKFGDFKTFLYLCRQNLGLAWRFPAEPVVTLRSAARPFKNVVPLKYPPNT